MQRKLIGQGLGGITVHLPKKWIDAHHLSKGDEVEIEDSEGKVIISPKKSKQKRETTIKLIGVEESLIRTLIGNTYRLGYDRIRVEYENDEQFNILNEIIQKRLIGFEIVKKESKKCIVENVTEPAEDQFDNIMAKLSMNIDELLKNTLAKCNNENESENIEQLQDRILKYDNFCRRILLRRRLDSKASIHLAFLMMMVHGQREIYYLNKAIGKNLKISGETLNLIDELIKMRKMIEEAYEEKKPELLTEINKFGRKLIYKEGYDCLENKKGKENVLIYHLLACARDFYQAVSPLSGLLM
jgi:phosphate uptake regulator